MDSIKNSRRVFLKQTMLASAAVTVAPSLYAKSNRTTANDRVNLAVIGIGNRGGQIINDLYATGLCNIVALCDVDMGAPHTAETIKKFPNASRFQDFRVMFDKMGDDIEAVSIATPDHSHFPITMHAMKLGKHVYVEKPLARTFMENELLVKAAKKYDKVVTQMGNQGHSEANYFQFKTWVETGIIKDVTAITAHMNSRRRWHGWDPNINSYPPTQQIPQTLDWELWQMAIAEEHGYHKDFINGQWRCWYDYGMGALGDWGAHIIDTAHEFLELGLPYEIDCTKATGHNPFFYPMSSTIVYRFPERKGMPALDLTWYDGLDNLPPIPEGYGVSGLDPNIPAASTGKIEEANLNPGKIIYSKDLVFKGGSHGSTLKIIPEEKAKEMASNLPEIPESPSNHFANFLKACKGEEKTRSPFEISAPLSQLFSLGVLSQQLHAKLVFNRDTKEITNNPLANKLLVGTPPRKGWEAYYSI
ncbi:Gfo/Idh/MocA family oxidoreductase [Flavobacteriaceae bacterium XHP0103]|uniref:Gfo/Idh/MocA family oxidoreductase n=1 Tax=Marixanthotalea marina TaxID=2844359 RepID=UPI002989C465|nr:Gfo/Idh/MocA family oxidoreductase [Marixanthotalea marina]MBU3820957.1 Gfo/Idh/MocA family oxidoreductase [Marixanthotalea marina]